MSDTPTPSTDPVQQFNNIGSSVSQQANMDGAKLAYRFIRDDGIIETLNYGELHKEALSISGYLLKSFQVGDRIVLMFRPGLAFIKAFFGCIYAGMIAVPVYPPTSRQEHWNRLVRIIDNAGASLLLMDADNFELAKKWLGGLEKYNGKFCLIDELLSLPALSEYQSQCLPDQLAFLQYSSGSTGEPKGVMVSHQNLMANEAIIKQKFQHSARTTVAGWLPQYHDMGLIGNILQPIYLQTNATLMSPASFLQNPFSWLKTISDYRISTSGAPNFAYELCASRITEQQKASLDLSSWRLAFSGAEPVKADTLIKFSNSFRDCGFDESAFYPCYGLAEATLIATGGTAGAGSHFKRFCAESLKHNRAVLIPAAESVGTDHVACGEVDRVSAVIVDPETNDVVQDGNVGEIWLHGQSVAQGYWGNPLLTESYFNVRTNETELKYLRTGDLGFVHDNEIYITGRLKDLIIIRGENFYPQDVEDAIQKEIVELRLGHGACFSIPVNGQEELVLINEVDRVYLRKANYPDLVEKIHYTIRRNTGLKVHDVILVKPNRILKTSSGKIRRNACREMYLNNGFEPLNSPLKSFKETAVISNTQKLIKNEQLNLLEFIAGIFKLNVNELNLDDPIASYGMDSIDAVQLQGKVLQEFGCELPLPDLLYGMTLKECIEVIGEKRSIVENTLFIADGPVNAFPLSSNQMPFWQFDKLYPNVSVYNLSVALRIDHMLIPSKVESAFESLLNLHPILKSSFPEVDGEPIQCSLDSTKIVVNWLNVASVDSDDIGGLVESNKHKPFDLAEGPIIRCIVYSGKDEAVIQFVVHHIAIDFWSYLILFKDFFQFYSFEKKGDKPIKDANNLYQKFCLQQAVVNKNFGVREPIQAIKQKLKGCLKPVPFVSHRKQPVKPSFNGSSIEFNISESMYSRINTACRSHEVTLFNYMLAVFDLLLYRYSNETEYVIGVPVSQRSAAGYGDVIGCFVDSKLVPSQTKASKDFASLLKGHKDYLNNLLQCREISNADILKYDEPAYIRGSQVFPNVRFSLHKAHILSGVESFYSGKGSAILSGVEVQAVPTKEGTAQADLLLTILHTDKCLSAALNFNTDLFCAHKAQQLADMYLHVLEQCIESTVTSISQFSLLGDIGVDQILDAREDKITKQFGQKGIHSYFKEQVERYPENICVRDTKTELTYDALDRSANQLAHLLKDKGVEKGGRVAIGVERSCAMVVAFLAVMKLGAVSLFCDTSIPKMRRKYMLETVCPQLMIIDNDVDDIDVDGLQLCNLQDTDFSSYSDFDPDFVVDSEDPLYLLFTSGSTGQPKGVEGLHRGIINRTLWMRDHFSPSASDTILHCTPMNYVRGERELLFAICSGATLYLAPEECSYRPDLLIEHIADSGATFTASSPSMLEMICNSHVEQITKLSSLKNWFIGADVLQSDLVAKIQACLPNLNMTYFYGSTEVSSDVSYYTIPQNYHSDKANLPVGKALDNTGIFILDDNRKVQPQNVTGEVYISGANISGGYLGAKELTKSKFPEFSLHGRKKCRFYRTGDLGYIDTHGNLNIIGRKDEQVSISGNRVELGEIESTIRSVEGVSRAVVLSKESSIVEIQIIAFVQSSQKNLSALKTYLADHLPKYMHPHQWVFVESIPCTELGKIDRKKLLSLADDVQVSRVVEKPVTEYESLLVTMWSGLISVPQEQIDVNDGFFDLGGNSVKLNRLYALLKQELPGSNVRITDIYKYSSIRKLAEFIRHNMDNSKAENTMDADDQRASKRRSAARKMNSRRKACTSGV